MTSDGPRTFEWDATNQLTAVNVGMHRTAFEYDGHGREVSRVEIEAGAVQNRSNSVWSGSRLCEERSSTNGLMWRRLCNHGESTAEGQLFLTADHLGSVREVTGPNGGLRARRAYDPWGRLTLNGDAAATASGFTGHNLRPWSGLWATWYRSYDANLGRWLSGDPIRLAAGDANLYRYVGNRPLVQRDRDGLLAVNSEYVGSWGCTLFFGAKVFLVDRRGEQDDQYSHCLATCYIARYCGYVVAVEPDGPRKGGTDSDAGTWGALVPATAGTKRSTT